MKETQEQRKNPENRGNLEEKPDRNPNGTFAEGREKTGGKVKGSKHFKTEIDELLDQIAENKDYTYRQALLKKVVALMIIDGDTTLIKEYWQQSDGKATENVDLTSGGEKVQPILVRFLDGKNGKNN